MKKETLIKLLITVILLVVIFRQFNVNLSGIFNRVEHPVYIILTFLFPCFLIPYISTNRWKLFLLQIGVREKLLNLAKINFKSMFIGITLPSSQGCDVFRVLFIEKAHPEYRGKVGSTVLVERIFGFVLLALWAFLFSMFLPESANKSAIVLIASICFFAIVLCVFLITRAFFNKWLLVIKAKIKIKMLDSVISYIIVFQKTLSVFPYKKVFFSSVVWIIAYQLSIVFVVYFIFKAYGINIPFVQHLALYPIISILSLIPVSISGLGIREGFFVYFYSSFGVPADIAVSVSLMNFCIMSLTPAFVGAVLYIIDALKSKTKAIHEE